MVNGETRNGVVKFIDAPINMTTDDRESFDFEFDWEAFADYFGIEESGGLSDLLDEKDVDESTLVMYHEVVCAECEASGDSAEFFMWCGGNPDQAMFDTGNCCIVSYEQLDGQQDTRCLGKCTSEKRRRGGF